MDNIGRFEKIILFALVFIAGLSAFILFMRVKGPKISFSSEEEENLGEAFREWRASVSDNVDQGEFFAYDEAGLKVQSEEEDYLAKKAQDREEEQGKTEVSPQTIAGSKDLGLATSDDPSWGIAKSRVTIVAFADFMCPFCAEFARNVMPQIQNQYGNQVKFIFRDLPITSLHPYSPRAHEAAECAHSQGLFWEMHDLIFANNASLTETKLQLLAQRAGLDMDKFNACFEGREKKTEVEEDLQAGISAGVQATPTLFVNNRKVEGLVSFSELSQIIEEELIK